MQRTGANNLIGRLISFLVMYIYITVIGSDRKKGLSFFFRHSTCLSIIISPII
jgi:hypothetical protein